MSTPTTQPYPPLETQNEPKLRQYLPAIAMIVAGGTALIWGVFHDNGLVQFGVIPAGIALLLMGVKEFRGWWMPIEVSSLSNHALLVDPPSKREEESDPYDTAPIPIAEGELPSSTHETAYDHRAHWYALAKPLAKPALFALLACALLTPLLLPDPQRTAVILGIALAGWAFVAFKAKKMSRAFLIVGGILAIGLAGMLWPGLLVSIAASILAYAFVRGLGTWGEWYYTRYKITTTRFTIESTPPWFFFRSHSKPYMKINRVDTVDSVQTWIVRILGLQCCLVTLDSPSQEDERFHDMGPLKLTPALQEWLASHIDDEDDN